MNHNLQHAKLSYHIEEAAELLSIGTAEFLDLCRQHKIHRYTIGRRKFVPSCEVDRLIARLLSDEIHRAVVGGGLGD